MANAGLSVKERLALLQTNNNNNDNTTTNNNNNNHNATNKPPSAPAKPVSPKPKPSPAENKLPGPAGGFKPVTANKPATPAPLGHKPALLPDKPSPSSKPMTLPNKPATPHKPTLANKPAPAVKPFTASASKPGGDDPAWPPKLRPVGAGRGASSESPQSPSRDTGGGGSTAPAVSASSDFGSRETGGSGTSSETQEKKAGAVFTPLKPVSVQERLAALRRKSSEVESAELKLKHPHSGVAPTSRSSPSTLKPSGVPSPTPASEASNGRLSEDSDSAKSEFPGIKRSDIAKSLTQAADRILRHKTATSAEDASEEASPQRRSHLFQRRSDGKKFRQLDIASVTSSDPAPTKPRPMHSVDLQLFLQAYAAAKENKLEVDSGHSGGDAAKGEEGEGEGEMEEMYVEAESTSVTIRGRKGSVKKAASARVSFIPEFTEEEEEQELYTDGTSGSSAPQQPLEAEETYDDCESALERTPKHPEPLPEEPDEIYEPLDEEVPEERSPPPSGDTPPPLPSPNLPEERRAREEENDNREKEEAVKKKDKAREELNKKEEKERKKKEEELKKMRRKFGLSESDEKVGDGVVKSNASGGVFSKDLAVTRGETIAILRMDGNPAGKWLVQNEHGKIGFVSSNNIQISTPTIKNLMAGIKHETPGTLAGTAEDPEEMYEALPEGEMDEIYEEL